MNKVHGSFHLALGLIVALSGPLFGKPQIVSFDVSDGNATLIVATSPGASYICQRNDDLTTRYWSDCSEAVLAEDAEITFQDDAAGPARFWRVFEYTNHVFWYDWTYLDQYPLLSAWGLGDSEEYYHHLDRPYEWYIDQANTGAGSGNNCGPSSVTMAIKWHDKSFPKTAEDARDWSYSWRGNGWWYTSDIINYLNLHSVPNTTSNFLGSDQLNGLISEGKILILCIDTTHLTRNTNSNERIDRFYSYAGGHFLVVKGARTVSGNLLLEVYDPNNWNSSYSDGTPKGRNRHLRASELASAIKNWWNYIIIVQPVGGGGAHPRHVSPWTQPVDPAVIRHAPGR